MFFFIVFVCCGGDSMNDSSLKSETDCCFREREARILRAFCVHRSQNKMEGEETASGSASVSCGSICCSLNKRRLQRVQCKHTHTPDHHWDCAVSFLYPAFTWSSWEVHQVHLIGAHLIWRLEGGMLRNAPFMF